MIESAQRFLIIVAQLHHIVKYNLAIGTDYGTPPTRRHTFT